MARAAEVSSARMQFDVVLRTFSELFAREGIRYAVIGGLAMQAWGSSRFTKDADLVVDAANRDRVIAWMESLGYETLHVSMGYSNHTHTSEHFGRVDFMYASGDTAERIFAAATEKPVIGDCVLPVASAEHLAMMKAIAMKNAPRRALYEGEDVRHLLKLPGVDRAAIRDYYARQGLLELFDAIAKAG
jgi:hypothetical protein